MNILKGFTSDASQTLQVVIEDGSRFSLTLTFRPQQNGWFFDLNWPGSGATPEFVLNGLRLVVSPNMLRQYRDVIPFGLGSFTFDASDPASISALFDGTTDIVLLSAADLAAIEETYFSLK